MRSTICCTCPFRNHLLPLRLTATVPLPSCPTADRSTTCTTWRAPTPNQPRRRSHYRNRTHRVTSPAVTNSIPSSPKNEEVLDGLEEETGFVWVGRYIYIYTDPDNYELLAQVRDWTTEDEKGVQQATTSTAIKSAFRVMTDCEGKLVWFGDYYG